MSLPGNKSWGDEEFEEETKDYETPVDENGIKYSFQFKTNEDGKKIRITRKIRVSKNVKKVNKRVEERRQVLIIYLFFFHYLLNFTEMEKIW